MVFRPESVCLALSLCLCLSQKSPAKKLSHAISKSLGCVPIGEPPHPVYPEASERPQDLAHPT